METNKTTLETARKQIVKRINTGTRLFEFSVLETKKTSKPFLKMSSYKVVDGLPQGKPQELMLWDNEFESIQAQAKPIMSLLYNISKMPSGIDYDSLYKEVMEE